MDVLVTLAESLKTAPEDREVWAVYADGLLDAGDPFGPIVRRALDGHSSVRMLQSAWEQHDESYWPGSLLSFGGAPTIDWRMGLWGELHLMLASLDREDEEDVDAILAICAHRAARVLRRLHLQFESQMDWEDHLYHLDALAPLEVPLSLDLSGARCDGFDVLAQIPGLQELKTWRVEAQTLASLARLQSLSLLGPLGADGLEWLGQMPALHTLAVHIGPASSFDLHDLRAPSLASLSLSWNHQPPAIDWATGSPLSHLALEGPLRGQRRLLDGLSQLPSLRSLALHDGLARLPAELCARLTHLSLAYAEEESLRAITRCTALATLRLLSSVPQRAILAALPALSALELFYPRALPDLGGIALERLVFHQNAIRPALVERLLALRSLGELCIEGSLEPETLAQLHRLEVLPGLRVLDLHRCHGLPDTLRWRFEGEELSVVFTALSAR